MKDRIMGRTGYTCIRHVFCSLNVLIWVRRSGYFLSLLMLRFVSINCNVIFFFKTAEVQKYSNLYTTGDFIFVFYFEIDLFCELFESST